MLEAVAARVDGPRRDRAARLAARYADFARRLERRRTLFRSPVATARASAFGRLVLAGDYRRDPWRFHPATIGRDVVSGVLFGGPPARS